MHPRLGAGRVAADKPGELAQGTLTIADECEPLELLFGGEVSARGVGRSTRRLAVAAVPVKGVPQAAVDEALWIASATIETA